MYTDMEQWTKIRRRVLVDGDSKRQIIRETGMHWQTLEKILNYSQPPGYRREKKRKSMLDEHVGWITDILESDKKTHKKQRHTSKRIFERLQQERDFKGSYTIVKQLVAKLRKISRDVYMPLEHIPGEAQVDYFQALANIDGILQKVHCFAMSLPYSDMFYVKAFPRECTESFWEGHVEAFRFFGGVPKRISYDNSRIAVQNITGCHSRELTEGFLRLQSHYLFESHFCTVRRANEKGVVENIVKYARSNFMVPVPQVKNFDELNDRLWEACYSEQYRRLRSKSRTKLELWQEESKEFLALPAVPFDPCRKGKAIASSLSLLRYKCNDYSVPTIYAHHELIIKPYVDYIKIYTREGEPVACHKRLWQKYQVSYDPRHYLRLLLTNPGALDHAQPFKGIHLPECFDLLRRKLEILLPEKHKGTKEYISILVLLEKYSLKRLSKAVEKAVRLTNPCYDIVKQYCMDIESPEILTFDLAGREHLNSVEVYAPELSEYDSLTGEVI
ncbi:MAG: IS21 family transposase [Phycisphaerae bacterium]|nr:IS21 family transposase [Phycisphaerae bacterium]